MQAGRVKLRDYGSTDLLVCPRCGFDHMHHQEVERWDRSEDARIETHILAGYGHAQVQVEEESGRNPSSRRSGLIIRFECEGCGGGPDDRIELSIAQHKGQTEIEWRFDPRPAKVESRDR